MKTCIYLRVSTDLQSVESQRGEMLKYAESLGLHVVKIYEENESGANDDRKQLKEMLNYVFNPVNDISSICCWELSRLGRSLFKTMEIVKILVDKKINLHCKKEDLTLLENGEFTFKSKMLISVLNVVADEERSTLKLRTARGRALKKAQGFWVAGDSNNVAYGFKVVNRKLEINEAEVPTVQRIFNMYVNGMGSHNICKELEKDGIKSKQGRHWKHQTINEMIVRTAYLEKNIIDQTTWEKAQYVRDNNLNKYGVNAKRDYIFKNNIYKCGCCGENMIYTGIKSVENGRFVSCKKHVSINYYSLMDACYFYIRHLNTFTISASKFTDNKFIADKITGVELRKKQLEDRITKADNHRKRLNKSYGMGGMSDEEFENELKEALKDLKSYNDELATVNRELNKLNDLLKKENDPETIAQKIKESNTTIKQFMNEFTRKIEIFPTTVNFTKHNRRGAVMVRLYPTHLQEGYYSFLCDNENNFVKLSSVEALEMDIKNGVVNIEKGKYTPVKSVKLFGVDELKTPDVKFDGEKFTEQV